MCGRFTLAASARQIAERFEVEAPAELAPRYNIAPGTDVPIVRVRSSGARALEWRRWGLVPHWARDPSVGNRMINARAETVASRPAFRDAFERRRCLVPADGFYEWQKLGRSRQPVHVRLADGALFAFAGLYARWHGPGGEVLDTCTLITTDANARLRPVHARMPVILAPADHATWLDRAGEATALAALLRPCPGDWLEWMPVSTRVNDPANDDAACIAPLVEPPRQQRLF